jgi:hypothetical protein
VLAGYELDEFVKFDGKDDCEACFEQEQVWVVGQFQHLALL